MDSVLGRIQEIVEKYYLVLLLLIALIAGFNLFYQLGTTTVQDWDEARQGVNAFEMVKNHQWIAHTYLDKTDYWNTKPPLHFWLIAASYQIFGYNAFALRFPAALLTLLSILLMMRWVRKDHGKMPALLTGFILSTSLNFIFYHAGRSGDFDAGISFLFVLSLFLLNHTQERKAYLYLSAVAAGLAFLYKSLAVLPLLAASGIYLLLFYKKLKLKISDLAVYVILAMIPVAVWAVLRYQFDGMQFFQAMFRNDLLERPRMVIEGQAPGNIFTYSNVILNGMLPWSLFFFMFLFYKNKISVSLTKSPPLIRVDLFRIEKTALIWLWILCLYALYSGAQTKLYWYITPIFPPIAAIAGICLADVFNSQTMPNAFFKVFRKALLPLLILFMIAAEAQFVWSGRYPHSADQELLRQLPVNHETILPRLFYENSLSQSSVFMIRVVGNREVRESTKEEFPNHSRTNDLLLLPVSPANREFVRKNKLAVVLEDADLMIIRKM